jgi:hypothetical protein
VKLVGGTLVTTNLRVPECSQVFDPCGPFGDHMYVAHFVKRNYIVSNATLRR